MVLGGGNIDMNVISRIIERGLREGRAAGAARGEAAGPPGHARAAHDRRSPSSGANVVEIYHNRAFSKAGLGEVQVEVTLETRGRPHIEELIAPLAAKGWQVAEEQSGLAAPGPFNATGGSAILGLLTRLHSPPSSSPPRLPASRAEELARQGVGGSVPRVLAAVPPTDMRPPIGKTVAGPLLRGCRRW